MAFTKVAPAGIGSTPGDGYRIGDSFLHSTGVEITNINATGILTAASLDISGDIDFDGHTELDNVNISGVTTASTINSTGNIEIDVDNGEFRCGAGGDFKISHSGSENILRSDFPTVFRNAANNETLAKFTPNGSVELYYNNIKMLETNIPAGHNGEVILGQKVHVRHTASGNGQIFPAVSYTHLTLPTILRV